MIIFDCVSCGRKLRVADELAGKRCRCPSCANVVPIPQASPNTESTSPTGSPSSSPNFSSGVSPSPAANLWDNTTASNNSGGLIGEQSSPGPSPGLWDGLNMSESGQPASSAQPFNPYVAAPQQSPYGYQPVPQYQPSSTEGHPLGLILGILSIVFALMSCVCYGVISPVGFILGIVAWVAASRERKKIAQGLIRPSGVVEAGFILGIIGTLMSAVIMILSAILIIFLVIHAVNNPRNF